MLARQATGVKHIVLPSLEGSQDFVENAENKDTRKVFETFEDREMYVPHLEGKQRVTQEFQDEGLPMTVLYTCFYYENFIYFFMGVARGDDTCSCSTSWRVLCFHNLLLSVIDEFFCAMLDAVFIVTQSSAFI